jgi:hypothetical protein
VQPKALEDLGPLLMGRRVWALENRTRPSTLPIGAGLIRRTPGIVVSKAFWAFPASDCNGWARLWGLAQGREWRRRKACALVPPLLPCPAAAAGDNNNEDQMGINEPRFRSGRRFRQRRPPPPGNGVSDLLHRSRRVWRLRIPGADTSGAAICLAPGLGHPRIRDPQLSQQCRKGVTYCNHRGSGIGDRFCTPIKGEARREVAWVEERGRSGERLALSRTPL